MPESLLSAKPRGDEDVSKAGGGDEFGGADEDAGGGEDLLDAVLGEGEVGGAGVAAIDGPFGFPWSRGC